MLVVSQFRLYWLKLLVHVWNFWSYCFICEPLANILLESSNLKSQLKVVVETANFSIYKCKIRSIINLYN